MAKFAKQLIIGGLIALAAGTSVSAAAAITIDFSFNPTFGTIGPVTGKLVFTTTGVGVSASEVYVLTAPAGTVNAATFGVNYLAGPASVTSNIFTLAADGTVTAANLELFNASRSDFFNLGDNGNGKANLVSNQSSGGLYAFNQGGFAGATYTLGAPVDGVPEAATWAMMIVGFGTVGVAMRRRVIPEMGKIAA